MVLVESIVIICFIILTLSLITGFMLGFAYVIYYFRFLNYLRNNYNRKFYEISGWDRFSFISIKNDKFWNYVKSNSGNRDPKIKSYKNKLKFLSKYGIIFLGTFFVLFIVVIIIIKIKEIAGI